MCVCVCVCVSVCVCLCVCGCIQVECKKTRKKQAVHPTTYSLTGQKFNRGFEWSDLMTLNNFRTEYKVNKETEKKQVVPAFSK